MLGQLARRLKVLAADTASCRILGIFVLQYLLDFVRRLQERYGVDACSPAHKEMANPGTLLPFAGFVNIRIKKQVILPVLIEPLRLSPLGASEWDLSESSSLVLYACSCDGPVV